MFASLTVGIGIDFSIHFSHAYAAARSDGRSDE
jgi:predicted RND superfamily exporter protein